jgi:LPXTG-motif cell wall-anchored protein
MFRKNILAMLGAAALVGVAIGGGLLAKGAVEKTPVKEAEATSGAVVVNLDFSSISSWFTSGKNPGVRAYNGSSYLYGSAGNGDAFGEYSWPGATDSSNKLTVTMATTADITVFQIWFSSNGSQAYTSGLVVGHTYDVTIGSWSSTAVGTQSGGYSLVVVDEASTTYSATVNFYVPYQLNSTYFDYQYWYTGNGSSHSDATMGTATADTTQTGCNYKYSVTINGLVSGTSFQLGIDLVEKAASAGSDTWTSTWTGSSVTVSAAITDDWVAASTAWDNNVAAYEKGLANVWAQSFLDGTASECTSLAVTSSTWSTLSTSYGSMSSDATVLAAAKADFQSVTASASSTAVLPKAAARYDFIYNKYGTSLSLTNFASRTTTSGAAVVSKTDSTDSSKYWIIGLAGFSLVASGAYFFTRKKRENA